MVTSGKYSMFNDCIAEALGSVSEAIVIEKISYLTEKSKEANRNCFDGRYWVYNSYREWHEKFFPYWSERNLKKIFAKLEQDGILITGNYNKNRIDRTKWYSVDQDALRKKLEEKGVPLGTKFTMPPDFHSEQSSQPIPYISYKYIDKKIISGDFLENSPLPKAYVRRYGFNRLTAMVDFVNGYIDDWYPSKMGRSHQEEPKRALFATKFLDFSDTITQDDDVVMEIVEQAMSLVDIPGHDPTIYWITTAKVLGYWGVKTGCCFYDELRDTEYQFVEEKYA